MPTNRGGGSRFMIGEYLQVFEKWYEQSELVTSLRKLPKTNFNYQLTETKRRCQTDCVQQ